jgi:hypothetical protein
LPGLDESHHANSSLYPLSLSVGVVEITETHDLQNFLVRADALMYDQKRLKSRRRQALEAQRVVSEV